MKVLRVKILKDEWNYLIWLSLKYSTLYLSPSFFSQCHCRCRSSGSGSVVLDHCKGLLTSQEVVHCLYIFLFLPDFSSSNTQILLPFCFKNLPHFSLLWNKFKFLLHHSSLFPVLLQLLYYLTIVLSWCMLWHLKYPLYILLSWCVCSYFSLYLKCS